MSIENHPNFHACKFAADVMASFYESLRGEASVHFCPDVKRTVSDFIMEIEEKVDIFVAENTKAET